MRIGVFGVGRGLGLAENFKLLGAEVVAICESHKERREAAMQHLDSSVVAYENFDDFINHPMDAVILANNFYQHAPYAVKCFERNLHVYSECVSNGTMGEGVELIRAFEKSKSIYMLAENYPNMLCNLEMKSVADGGSLGKILYAEAEYNHPIDAWDTNFTKGYQFYPKHWRHFLPKTYYITHSLGPVMHITGATPKKVTAFAMFAPLAEDVPNASYCADASANITTFNDDGSVFRVTAFSRYGGHHNSVRICGDKGQIENLRGIDDQVMVRYNDWNKPEGQEAQKLYTPLWKDADEKILQKTGHGGCDYITARIFFECVKQGKQPPAPFDIYSSVTMSSVGILAHRSSLEGGKVYDVPDFKKEEDRTIWEKDYLTPFYGADGSAPTLPCCSHPDYQPTQRQMELYLEELKK